MNNHIFNYSLSYFPLDIIYTLSLSNKQIRKRIIQFWKRYNHINFLDLFYASIVKKFGIDSISTILTSLVVNNTFLFRYEFEYTNFPTENDNEFYIYYESIIKIWKRTDYDHRYFFLSDTFLYKFRKLKFLKYVFTNYPKFQITIFTNILSFGLFDFWNYGYPLLNTKTRVAFENHLIMFAVWPRNFEAYIFCKERNYSLPENCDYFIMNSLDDFPYFCFLRKGFSVDDNKMFRLAIQQNKIQIGKYIIESYKQQNSRLKFILQHKLYIDFFHYLGYKFKFTDLEDIINFASKAIIEYCLLKYRHELIPEHGNSNTKLEINNSTDFSLIYNSNVLGTILLEINKQ